jgi:hypothetical protein
MRADIETRRTKDLNNDESLRQRLEILLVTTLRSFDLIQLKTVNSDYNIFVLSPESGLSLVQGGKYFPFPVEVVICGANLGGHLHTEGIIEVGRGLELMGQNRRIVTSPIEQIRVQRASVV